jgi:hypothetical protein
MLASKSSWRTTVSNVVDQTGAPISPEVTTYDQGLVHLLEAAIANVKRGKTIGVAIIEVQPEYDKGPHDWGTYCTYLGPRLSLLAGCYRVAHNLQIALDERQRSTGR